MIKTSRFVIPPQSYDLSNAATRGLPQMDVQFLELIQPQTNLHSSIHNQVSNVDSSTVSPEKPVDKPENFANSTLLSLLASNSSTTFSTNMEPATVTISVTNSPLSEKAVSNQYVSVDRHLEIPFKEFLNNNLTGSTPLDELKKSFDVDQDNRNFEPSFSIEKIEPWRKDAQLSSLSNEIHDLFPYQKSREPDIDITLEYVKSASSFFEEEMDSAQIYVVDSHSWAKLDGHKLKLTKSTTEGIKQFEELVEFTWYATGQLSSFTTVANTTPVVTQHIDNKKDYQVAIPKTAYQVAVIDSLHGKQHLSAAEDQMAPVTYKDTYSDSAAQRQVQGNHAIISFIQATFPDLAKYRITISLSNSDLNIIIRDYDLKDIEKKNIKNLLTDFFNSQGKIINSITFNGKLYS